MTAKTANEELRELWARLNKENRARLLCFLYELRDCPAGKEYAMESHPEQCYTDTVEFWTEPHRLLFGRPGRRRQE